MTDLFDEIQKAGARLNEGALLVNREAFAQELTNAEGTKASQLVNLKKERQVMETPIYCGSEVTGRVVPVRSWTSAVQDGSLTEAAEAYWQYADSPRHSYEADYVLVKRSEVNAARDSGMPVDSILDQFKIPYLVVEGLDETILPMMVVEGPEGSEEDPSPRPQ